MRGFAQFMMRKTEIVGASDQIHPRLKRSKATGCMAGFARQAGQPLPEGSIQALNKSRVEAHATMREQKQLLCLGQQAMGHPSRDLDDPLFLRPFDHRANIQLWPDLQAGSPSSLGLLDFLSERSADTVGIGRPAICQDEQGSQGLGRSTNLGHQEVCQAAISRPLHDPCHPQACRNHHGQSHPRYHFTSFHSNFIGLNVHQVQLPLFNDLLVHLLTMGSRSIAPVRYGSFIQTKGMHNGLDWASIGQERHDHHDEVSGFTQALKHRSPMDAEGVFADLTAITLPSAIMNDDMALFSLASCGTRLIGAKLVRRVHRLCRCLHMLQHANGRLLFQALLPFSPDSGVLPELYYCARKRSAYLFI